MSLKEKCKAQGIKYSFYTVFLKRFIDILLSLLAIIILSPFLIIFSILTLIFNGHPIIFKQYRPGKNHRVFAIYKFRSMNNKKDKDGNLLPDEMRVTTWGKIIRKLSIDELPQLFNILKGDMSIVGPRPRLVKDLVFYEKNVFDNYLLRPGLTGYTQVSGRNKNTWEQVFEKDRYYLEHQSFWFDLKILFMTFVSIFKSKGESHSNAEEDNQKEQEYYYADYLLRTEKITKEQYDKGIEYSKDIIKNNKPIEFLSELREVQKEKKTEPVKKSAKKTSKTTEKKPAKKTSKKSK